MLRCEGKLKTDDKDVLYTHGESLGNRLFRIEMAAGWAVSGKSNLLIGGHITDF